MFRFVAATWGLAAGWLWLVFGARDGTAVIGGVLLLAASLGLGIVMVRRSRRLRGEHDYVNARLEYHAGMSRDRWRRAKPARDDDGGRELTLGGGW